MNFEVVGEIPRPFSSSKRVHWLLLLSNKVSSIKMTFYLQMILYYDKYKAEDAYFFAQRIAEWLKKYEDDDNYIFLINYLQLKIRKRALTIDEMSKLIEIYKQTNRNDIKFGCLILLNRQEEAMNYFNLLNKNEQNALRGLPIYKFVER